MKRPKKIRMMTTPDGKKLPVEDAEAELYLQPNEDDIKTAVKADPTRCAYANCCRRILGSHYVWIVRRVAYVEMNLRRGQTILRRFMIKKGSPARGNIETFDHKATMELEAVKLYPPKKTERLGYKKPLVPTRKGRRALVKGTIGLRDAATGQFHFTSI